MSGEILCHSELSAAWGLELSPLPGAVFHVVDRGACWLRFEGERSGIPLSGGDVVLVSRPRRHQLTDTPRSKTIPIEELIRRRGSDKRKVLHWGGGGARAVLVCGQFRTDGHARHSLFELLPPFIHLRSADGNVGDWLRTSLAFLASETGSTRPGSETMASHLTEILFVQVVRAWLETQPSGRAGWLGALRDPLIGAAIEHLHARPGHDWTVASLASAVGASRSSFAARFRALVGKPPLEYLTGWRMERAIELMRDESLSLASVASQIGYESEAAFAKAFKREVGSAPGAYRRQLRAA